MHRFDLQDWQWALIADLFPSNDGKPGEPWKDHRTVMNGMFHVLHTGCPWRDVPERYGKCKTVYDRFNRYRKDGTAVDVKVIWFKSEPEYFCEWGWTPICCFARRAKSVVVSEIFNAIVIRRM